MSEGINYKISLDADISGGQQAQKALNGVAQAGTAAAQVMSGNVAGAIVSLKNSFTSLKVALIANPFTAIALALASIAGIVATTMWGKYKQGIEESRTEIEKLIERRKALQGLDRPLIDRARDEVAELSKSGGVAVMTGQEETARGISAGQRERAAEKDKEAAIYQANIGRGASESMVLQARLQAEALRTSALEFELIADLYAKGAKLTTERLEQERQEAADLAASNTLKEKLQSRRRSDAVQDAERATDHRISLVGKSDEDQVRIRIQEATARYSVVSNRMRREDTNNDEFAAYTVELEGITADLAELNEQLRQIGEDRARQLLGVEKAEAEYDFAKLTPDQQLAGIKERMKEIMGNAGWEKDAGARAEMLDLRKRRDAIEAAKKADAAKKDEDKKKPVGKSYNLLGDDQRIDLLEQARRSRSDDVIRMAGSRAGGFIDSDGVRRMAGSRAGGFSDRLRPSAFARTAAELEAKRSGMAMAAAEKTGEEQPVEIKGDAVNYLRIMADSLRKEA